MRYVFSALVAVVCCVGGWLFTKWYLKKNKSGLNKIKKLPLVIAASGVLFAAIAAAFPMFITDEDMSMYLLFRAMTLIDLLFFAALIDYKLHLIPNMLLLILLACGAVNYGTIAFLDFSLFRYEIIMALLGCAVCFIIFLIGKLISHNGMGMGDVKLAAVIGFMLGLDSTIGCLVWSLVIGAITGVVMMIAKKANRKTKLPFAPFFFVGTLLSHIIFIVSGLVGG